MGACNSCAEKEQSDVSFVTPDNLNRMIKRDFDQIFDQMDNNGDGKLDRKEMEELLKHLKAKGVIMSAKTPGEIIELADSDGDGSLQREEFLKFLQSECLSKRENLLKLMSTNKQRDWLDTITQRAFKAADKDRGGSINYEELMTYLEGISKQLGEKPISREQVTKMIKAVDRNNDGKLSKMEFRQVMQILVTQMYFHSGESSIETSGELIFSISPQ